MKELKIKQLTMEHALIKSIITHNSGPYSTEISHGPAMLLRNCEGSVVLAVSRWFGILVIRDRALLRWYRALPNHQAKWKHPRWFGILVILCPTLPGCKLLVSVIHRSCSCKTNGQPIKWSRVLSLQIATLFDRHAYRVVSSRWVFPDTHCMDLSLRSSASSDGCCTLALPYYVPACTMKFNSTSPVIWYCADSHLASTWWNSST